MFNQFDHIPDGLLDAKTEDLLQLLQLPTLIHLDGIEPQPLFVCTLLHGNETTGFRALQQLLKRYQDESLPRALSIFIGNLEAAAAYKRRLPGQLDYNRIWPGTSVSQCNETDIMETVTNIMRTKKPFASIDIHNNTGKNPHYACVNVLSAHSLQVASRFADTTVYFTSPKGVQSSAFADFCPAVVLECGQSTDSDSVGHATQYLETMITLDHIPGDHPQNTQLYHTVARVTVPEPWTTTTDSAGDIGLYPEHEDDNFRKLESGTAFARVNNDEAGLMVTNESNEDVSDDFLERDGDILRLKEDVILSMYTSDATAIKQDCLCYFMENLKFST